MVGPEEDGRWWAGIESMPGVMACGETRRLAIAAVHAHQDTAETRGYGQTCRHLPVLLLTHPATVLPRHPSRMSALLDNPGLVHNLGGHRPHLLHGR
jgi:hypothetical protein